MEACGRSDVFPGRASGLLDHRAFFRGNRLLSLQDGVTVPNVRFQLISKLFGQTLRCVFSVVVVILEVEIKAT